MKQLLSLVLLFVLAVPVLADEAAEHPCKDLASKCEAAGFHKNGMKEGKGLFANCIKPLMAGQTVPGVTISADELKNCQAKKAEHAAHKAAKGAASAAPQAPAAVTPVPATH